MRSFPSLPRVAFAVALVLAPAAVNAEVVQTNLSDKNPLRYVGEASTSDLINGLTPTVVTGWDGSNGASSLQINDGLHGKAGIPVRGAWTNPGAMITFNLGLGTGKGYDLTSIESIAAWEDNAYGNQAYKVEVRLAGSAVFTPLASVTNTPFVSTDPLICGGATKTTITDSTGVLAKGVEFIRFTAANVSNSSAGKCVLREIDVKGTATAPGPP
jgi:hypothetical protein